MSAAVPLAGADAGVVLTGTVGAESPEWCVDHAVAGTVLLPGTAFVEMAVRAGDEVGCGSVEELTLRAPLALTGPVNVQVAVGGPDASGRRPVTVHSRPAPARAEAEWTLHAEGLLAEGDADGADGSSAGLTTWPPPGARALPTATLYDDLASEGYDYGPAFQGVRALWRHENAVDDGNDGGDEVFAEVELPAEAGAADGYLLHPALLDAALHAVAASGLLPRVAGIRLPFAWSGVRVHASGARALRVLVRRTGRETVELTAVDGTGAPVVSVASLALVPVAGEALRARSRSETLLAVRWEESGPAEFEGAAVVSGPEGLDVLIGPAGPDEPGRSEDSGALSPVLLDLAGPSSQELGELVLSVLEVVRRFLTDPGLRDRRLVVRTRGAVAVDEGDRAADPAAAAVWGLVRSAQSEHPGRFVLIDTDETDDTDDTGEPGETDVTPVVAVVGEEPQIALRGGTPYVPRLVRHPLAEGAVAPAFDPGRTVLVTGGTGGLGSLVARHLVTVHGARRLLLLSRSGTDAAGADELIRTLAESGAVVDVRACDVGDREALARIVEEVQESAHPLGAVVHMAGVLQDATVEGLSDEAMAAVLRPKARAAWHLHELTAGLDLSAFVLFSSVAGVLGNPGQANYAAANAFLDALAARRRQLGLPALSLAWGLWEQPSGMTGRLDGRDLARMRRAGLLPLSAGEGLALLDAALAGTAARDGGPAAVVPARIDAEALVRAGRPVPPLLSRLAPRSVRRAVAQGTRSGQGSQGATTASRSGLEERLAGLSADERERLLLGVVRDETALVLGHESGNGLDVAREFRDLGLDSLMAVEVRNRLAAVTGLALPSTVVFDHPTPHALARSLDERLAGDEAVPGAAESAVARGAGREDEPVAVVGMACRYPGAVNGPDDLWRLVLQEREAVGEFPVDRGWDLAALFDTADGEGARGTSATRHGGFLEDAAGFDPALFGISPREALAMDPQQRLLLEVSWEALENAGIPAEDVHGSRGGVFAGLMYHDYGSGRTEVPEGVEGHLLTGGAGSVASGRIAYALGLEGPAMTVDTACSSSLVTLHLAAQSLRRGECDLALAGGVTVMVTPDTFVEFSRQGGLARDGRCKSFAEGADGTGWSEGVGMLLVERLSDARRNGHRVLAVLRGSAVNQDGASNGLTAPSGTAQQRVIREALADAGLAPADVDAVEGHGTGTALGDPIEAGALLETYGRDRTAGRPLHLGSVKSNLGHTQAAAGVAGVIKMVKALDEGVLPRSLHAAEPSSHVDWASGAVELLARTRAWPEVDRPRRAAVSSFGISGTNAHVILEQAPPPAEPPERGPDPAVVPLLLSAADGEALRAQAARIAETVETAETAETAETETVEAAGHAAPAATADSRVELADVAWSLTATRSALPWRAAVVADGREQAVERLRALAEGWSAAGTLTGRARKDALLAVVFSGQGSQRLGMGRELCETQPVFAAAFDEVCEHFAPHLDQPLRDVVFGTDQESLDRTDHAQAAIFAVEVALYRLLEHWGVRPGVLIGHSIGGFAAACVAGVWSLADACALVAARGRLMRAVPADGAMAAVEAGEEEAGRTLAGYGDRVCVSAVNGPSSVVVSGDREAVEEVAERFRARGRRVRLLRVSHAFHSAHMDTVLDDFADALSHVSFHPPALPVVSDLTGAPADPDALCSPAYWVRHVREAVRFADGVGALHAAGATAYLELGSAGALAGAVRESLPEDASAVIVAALRTDRSETAAFVEALSALHLSGLRVEWSRAFEGTGARTVELPGYPFRHRRFWLSAPARTTTALDTFGGLASELDLTEEQTRTLDALLSTRDRADRLRRCAHRVAWVPVTADRPRLHGRWRVALPAGADPADPRATALRSALERAGAEVVPEPAAGAAGAGDVAGVVVAAALAPNPGLFALAAAQEAARDAAADAPLWFLTERAVSTGAQDPVRAVEQAAVWGLGQVVSLELPAAWGGLADVGDFGDRDLDALCAVLAEANGPGREDQVALRAGHARGRRVVPAAGGTAGTRAAGTAGTGTAGTATVGTVAPRRPWRAGGTVLVTGGTGALGAHVARWLAVNGARRLVLTGRRGEAAPGAAGLVAALRESGAEVSVESCDTADRAALADLLARHRPTSVFHAAGAFEAHPVAGLSAEEWAAVVAGKADGARHLNELTQELRLELDAFVLFSSVAGVWGSAGQAAYAAGNAVLDALAQRRRADGLCATSVAWGPWAGAGMAEDEEVAVLLRRGGLRPLDPAEALAALGRTLESDRACHVVADVDWERLTTLFSAVRPGPLFALAAAHGDAEAAAEGGAADEAAAGGDFARRMGALPPVEQERAVLALVRDEVAAALGHDTAHDLDVTQTFKSLGLDSLTAVEARNRITAATGLALPATVVFDHPTPQDLARSVRGRLAGAERESAPPAAVTDATADEPVAVVGMACRYPGGAVSPEDLWRLVAEERDAVVDFPTDRGWDLATLYDPDSTTSGTTYSREGGFLDDIAGFDPGLFGISPREALAMDPHQRLLLETTWEAFERAGIPPTSLRGSSTGVFVGAGEQDYAGAVTDAPEGVANHLLLGHTASVLSGRVAYVFGLEGPTLTLDTACSAGLVALHLAVRALRGGECDLAVAGGATVMSTPGGFVEFSRQQVLGRTGRCRSYSEDADGSAFSEGIGTLVVERLSDARRNGHPVLAVIRGSAVNQDGASNGLSAPSGTAQQRVIRQALSDAGLPPDGVDAVEGHGTGTPLGDPIEASALITAYGQDRPAERPLYLGSLKSNIGHTQASAGIAGVMKMVHALRHGVLPRTLHVAAPSSHVDWSSGGLELLTESRAWPQVERARRAAVSAFGISGTNAHVILEEPPGSAAQEEGELGPEGDRGLGPDPQPVSAPAPAALASGPAVLPLSAATGAGLRDQARRLHGWLAGRPGLELPLLGRALAATRVTELEHRAAVVAGERDEALAALTALADSEAHAALVTGAAAPGAGPVLVFPGQGSQWPGMALGLLDSSPVFARSLDVCDKALGEFVDWSVLDVLHGRPGAPSMERLDVVQPLLFAVMVALADTWRAAGVVPAAVVGHSQGEVAAACVAGALSLPDAARIICLRSKAMQEELSGLGAMASVARSREWVAARLERWGGRLSVAAVNGPESVVVSGEAAAVEEFLADAESAGVRARRVKGAIAAGHSAQVELVRERVRGELAPVAPRPGEVPVVSTVTAALADGSGMDADYWYRNMREPVRFDAAVRELLDRGHRVFLEASPHPVLLAGLQEVMEDAGASASALGTLRRDEGGPHRFALSLGAAYVAGAPVDWPRAVHPQVRAAFVDLPTYAFQRQRYWLDAPRQSAYFTSPAAAQAPDAAGEGDGAAAQRRFWDAVVSGDVEALLGELPLVNGQVDSLLDVLPALADWRETSREDAALDRWRHRVVWEPVRAAARPSLAGDWLLLVPDDAAARSVAAQIGTALDAHGARTRQLGLPAGAGRAAVAEALDGFEAPAGVLALTGLLEGVCPGHDAVPSALAATLAVVQALGDVDWPAPLWVLTRGAVGAEPADAVSAPEQATVWGLGATARQEHPERWGGVVDLPAGQEPGARELTRLVAAVSGDTGEDEVAVRATAALTRRLVPAPLDERPERWKPTGTVLVTGGTGALGAHVARHLAALGAPHLLLAGRRGPDAPGARELEAELAALGARVTVAACDLGDRTAVEELLARVPVEDPLTAVVHTAAVVDDALLTSLTADQLQRSLRVKARAAHHLDELTRDLPLDAFVLFSSFAGVTADAGQGGYAPGNAYLDALALRRRALGLPALSVGWGHWAGGSGLEGGEVMANRLQRFAMESMDPGRAVRALERAVACDSGHLVVADVDFGRSGAGSAGARPTRLFLGLPGYRKASGPDAADPAESAAGAAEAQTGAGLRDRLGEAAAGDRAALVRDLVLRQLAAVLGHADPGAISATRLFRELGIDSLTAVEFRNRLGAATGLRLPVGVVFDHPTPEALAAHVLTELALDDGPTTDGPASAEDEDLPVEAELGRLEAALDRLDAPASSAVASRLRALLARLPDTPAADGDRDGDGGGDALASATSAEEVLGLIQKRFGR
ncbi:type I polyketide synthase [Streptomyces diacarni]|uniref:type I polyketide synthase n=1 Tax=Streptomyces diacarni TaxID=2800381 RepID=UPI0033D02816